MEGAAVLVVNQTIVRTEYGAMHRGMLGQLSKIGGGSWATDDRCDCHADAGNIPYKLVQQKCVKQR